MEVGTPLTMEGFTMNPAGTIYGWDAVPEQSMQRRLPQQTPVDNLLLAGAWTFPGCGQSAVLVSGSLAADAILKKSRLR
jgi:phytoene dehydrogenase-like protein